MKTDPAAAAAPLGGVGGALSGSGPARVALAPAAAAALLEEAADLLVVHLDFPAALRACERAGQGLSGDALADGAAGTYVRGSSGDTACQERPGPSNRLLCPFHRGQG